MVARDDATIARRELRLRAANAWLELARADTAVVTLTAAATQAQELERIAQGRLDAGAGGEVDVTSAHAARARAEVAVATAKRETSARSAELAGLLGWDPATDRHSTGPLPGGAGDLERLRLGLASHPEHAAALAQITAREASANRISVARRPGLAFELTGSFNDPTLSDPSDPTHLISPDVFAGLNIELPLFGHIGDQLRAANTDTAAARERLTAVDAELAAGLVATYRRWQAATEHVGSLERDVMPAQQKATQLAQQAYREGARELVTALQATRDLQDVSAELANARIDSALAWQQLTIAAGIDGDAR
jgi:outer membrane protein TolC